MNEGDDDISVDENEDPAVLASPEALETSSFVEKPSLEDLIDDTEETALGSDNTNKIVIVNILHNSVKHANNSLSIDIEQILLM
ncbi:unnamed protein product, partial [Rotaria sp. Silwood1]